MVEDFNGGEGSPCNLYRIMNLMTADYSTVTAENRELKVQYGVLLVPQDFIR